MQTHTHTHICMATHAWKNMYYWVDFATRRHNVLTTWIHLRTNALFICSPFFAQGAWITTGNEWPCPASPAFPNNQATKRSLLNVSMSQVLRNSCCQKARDNGRVADIFLDMSRVSTGIWTWLLQWRWLFLRCPRQFFWESEWPSQPAWTLLDRHVPKTSTTHWASSAHQFFQNVELPRIGKKAPCAAVLEHPRTLRVKVHAKLHMRAGIMVLYKKSKEINWVRHQKN